SLRHAQRFKRIDKFCFEFSARELSSDHGVQRCQYVTVGSQSIGKGIGNKCFDGFLCTVCCRIYPCEHYGLEHIIGRPFISAKMLVRKLLVKHGDVAFRLSVILFVKCNKSKYSATVMLVE